MSFGGLLLSANKMGTHMKIRKCPVVSLKTLSSTGYNKPENESIWQGPAERSHQQLMKNSAQPRRVREKINTQIEVSRGPHSVRLEDSTSDN